MQQQSWFVQPSTLGLINLWRTVCVEGAISYTAYLSMALVCADIVPV